MCWKQLVAPAYTRFGREFLLPLHIDYLRIVATEMISVILNRNTPDIWKISDIRYPILSGQIAGYH